MTFRVRECVTKRQKTRGQDWVVHVIRYCAAVGRDAMGPQVVTWEELVKVPRAWEL